MNVLIIIPARGGSKGIPRKNLRALAGKPLIYYSIQTALHSKYKPDVYVSSDDDEILSIANKLGAKIHKRSLDISLDATTLDPVIYYAYQAICKQLEGKSYDLIVTLQPTSPLLQTHTLDKAIGVMVNSPSIDTVIAATDNTSLTWIREGNRYLPNYTKRVNRQFLKPTFKETGAFLITRSSIITENNRIGRCTELYLLDGGERIDIDTYDDWSLCEYYLRRKSILFVVAGNSTIGLGHVYNTLLIANDILAHRVTFLVDKQSDLAKEKIASKNYQVYQQKQERLLDDVVKMKPDVVVNDILDTDSDYIDGLKRLGIKVINFEDLGDGARKADLVINAIYPEEVSLPNHYFGADYFVLRDEFLFTPAKIVTDHVSNVLLTFGGVDPCNLTAKVLESIYSYCCRHNMEINVVAGFGYNKHESLKKFERIKVHNNTTQIADIMHNADIIFTSAGRTIYEVASLGVPAVVLAQNDREMTHFFANEKYGFVNLGLGNEVHADHIFEKFVTLVANPELRKQNGQLMQRIDLRSGRQRIQMLINKVLED